MDTLALSNAAQGQNAEQVGSSFNNAGFWGSIVGAGVNLVNSFNYRKQENDIEIARANAEALRAQSDLANVPQRTKSNVIWIIAVIAVVVIVLLLISKRK